VFRQRDRRPLVCGIVPPEPAERHPSPTAPPCLPGVAQPCPLGGPPGALALAELRKHQPRRAYRRATSDVCARPSCPRSWVRQGRRRYRPAARGGERGLRPVGHESVPVKRTVAPLLSAAAPSCRVPLEPSRKAARSRRAVSGRVAAGPRRCWFDRRGDVDRAPRAFRAAGRSRRRRTAAPSRSRSSSWPRSCVADVGGLAPRRLAVAG